jgi:hypothetical protein
MNRRLAFIVLILSVTLSACMSGLSPISAGNSQATAMVLAGTMAAQTMASLPTQTAVSSNTPPPPTFTVTVAPNETEAPPDTATSTPEATGTADTAVTATGSATGAVTISTVPNTVVGTITATSTLTPGPLLWGTVPPSVPYGRVTLVNLTNEMVYISFHCTIENGLTSYLEYPVYARITVSIPTGACHYIAWVKGQQFTGDVHIKKFEEYTFTFKKTKIFITQP